MTDEKDETTTIYIIIITFIIQSARVITNFDLTNYCGTDFIVQSEAKDYMCYVKDIRKFRATSD
jgi:hypothetical protein